MLTFEVSWSLNGKDFSLTITIQEIKSSKRVESNCNSTFFEVAIDYLSCSNSSH